MIKNLPNQEPPSTESMKPSSWTAAILFGLGLWLLKSGPLASPPPLIILGIILILSGGIIFTIAVRKSLSNPKDLTSSFIIPLSIGIGIAVILALAEHGLRYLHFPYPLDDGEGFCLNQALMMARGLPLYPPIATPPFIVTNYPPFFPALLSLFTDPENISFFPGRFLSVISTIIICSATAGIVRAITNDIRAGWIAAILVASSPVIYFWGALLRVDILASMLGLVAILIAVRAKGARVLWSIPFLIAALFTRQSSVEAAIAIVIALFFFREPSSDTPQKNRKNAILLTVVWIIAVAAIFIFLQAWSDGEFWRHTVTYTRTRFFPDRAFSNVFLIGELHVLIFLMSFLALPKALTDPRRRVIGIFFIASLGTAFLSGKVGSDMNYFINLIIAASCLAGLFIADLFQAARSLNSKSKLLIPALLIIPASIIHAGFLDNYRSASFTPTAEAYHYGSRVVEVLESARGPILSEDEGFCLLSGHDVIFNPFIMSFMAQEGVWDETPFINAIENREFNLIMLRFFVDDPTHDDRPGVGGFAGWDRFTPAMEQAISENYELDPDAIDLYRNWEIFMRRRWFIYRPKTDIQEEPKIPDINNLLDAPDDMTE